MAGIKRTLVRTLFETILFSIVNKPEFAAAWDRLSALLRIITSTISGQKGNSGELKLLESNFMVRLIPILAKTGLTIVAGECGSIG